jgi:hypothetical protein
MSHLCSNNEYRSQPGATNRPENIIRYVGFVSLVCFYVLEFESSRRFQFSFTDFSLVRAGIFKVTAHERIQRLYQMFSCFFCFVCSFFAKPPSRKHPNAKRPSGPLHSPNKSVKNGPCPKYVECVL